MELFFFPGSGNTRNSGNCSTQEGPFPQIYLVLSSVLLSGTVVVQSIVYRHLALYMEQQSVFRVITDDVTNELFSAQLFTWLLISEALHSYQLGSLSCLIRCN